MLKSNQEKNSFYAPGIRAIRETFRKLHPLKPPLEYATLIRWSIGGKYPLDAIGVYDAGDYYHFVSYGISELYEKISFDKEVSGFGMEFTFKLKKDLLQDVEKEIEGVCGILQHLAWFTCSKGEIFLPFEYIYTGQKRGIDVNGESNIVGLITVPDKLKSKINTPNGEVLFISFVGVTEAEAKRIDKGKMSVEELYRLLGSDITDYHRTSIF